MISTASIDHTPHKVGVQLSSVSICSTEDQVPTRCRKCRNRLAITQCLIGVICIVFGIICEIVSAKDKTKFTAVGCGIWGGVWMIMTAVIGIYSVKHPTNVLNRFYIAFCVISTLIATASFGLYFPVLLLSISREYRPPLSREKESIWIWAFVPILIALCIEFVVSIVAAVCSCGLCCNYKNPKVSYDVTNSNHYVKFTSTNKYDRMTSQVVYPNIPIWPIIPKF